MNYNKKCIWCPNFFYASRIDEIYCSTRCRNGFHNDKHKKILAPYKKRIDDARYQDERLEVLWRVDKTIFINWLSFEEAGIDPSKFLKATYDNDGYPLDLSFVKYGMIRKNFLCYQLVRL